LVAFFEKRVGNGGQVNILTIFTEEVEKFGKNKKNTHVLEHFIKNPKN